MALGICLTAQPKEGIDRTKKVQRGTRGFCPYFWEVDHPLWDVWMKKTQILIANQKEEIDQTKKGQLAAKKSTARD